MKTFQIITNSSCNLRCTYCYEYLDSKQNKLDDVIEYLETVARPNETNETECIIDFIGGEPFFVPDLLEGIMSYCDEHLPKWGYKRYTFSFSSNGTLLHKPKQEALLQKYGKKMYIGVSIDGDKEKHDRYRLTVGGKGSFDDCVKGFNAATKYLCKHQLSIKATFTKDSIKDYARSMKFLFQEFGNKVEKIQGNFNFEERFDVYDGALIANEQLEIIRFITSNDFFAEYLFVSNNRGDKHPMMLQSPLKKPFITPVSQNRCGSCSGKMLSLGYDKKIYGCNRFSTSKRENVDIGHLEEGKYVENETNGLREKVFHAYKDLPEWCQSCRFNKGCSDCVAIPIDEGITHHEYYRQNRMCGYTKATHLAKLYNALIMLNHHGENDVKPNCTCHR